MCDVLPVSRSSRFWGGRGLLSWSLLPKRERGRKAFFFPHAFDESDNKKCLRIRNTFVSSWPVAPRPLLAGHVDSFSASSPATIIFVHLWGIAKRDVPFFVGLKGGVTGRVSHPAGAGRTWLALSSWQTPAQAHLPVSAPVSTSPQILFEVRGGGRQSCAALWQYKFNSRPFNPQTVLSRNELY